jgi:ComEC/Rec2-related protein
MQIPEVVRNRILHAAAFLLGVCCARSLFYPEDWPLLHRASIGILPAVIGVELVFCKMNKPLIGCLILLGMAWASLRFQSLARSGHGSFGVLVWAQCLESINESKSTYLVRVEGLEAPLRMKVKEGLIQAGAVFEIPTANLKPLVCRGHEPGRFCYARWSMDRCQAYSIFLNKAPIIHGRQPLPLLFRFREEIKTRLCRRTSLKVRPWALALVMGDKGQFDHDEISRVKDLGLMHVLAISGLHIGLFFQCLLGLIRVLPLSLTAVRWGQLALLAFVWGYAALCHMVPSVLRASIFITWSVIGRSFLRCPSDPQLVWPISLLIQLVIRPQDAFDMGFQLSYLATAALFYIMPNGPGKRKGLKVISTTLICSVLTFPLLVFSSGYFSLGFWIGSLCLAPVLFLVIPLFWMGLFLPHGIFLFEDAAMQFFLFLWGQIPRQLVHYWQLDSISVYEALLLELSLVYFLSILAKLFSHFNAYIVRFGFYGSVSKIRTVWSDCRNGSLP